MGSMYMCTSYYHLYIAIIKSILSKETSSIYLSDTLENYAQISENLIKYNIVDNVYILPMNRVDLLRKESQRGLPLLRTLQKYFKTYKCFDDFFSKNIDMNKEIYLFNDCNLVGQYFRLKRQYYHLLEDGRDCFRLFDYIKHVKFFKFRHIISKLNIIPMGFGLNKYALDIEVNSLHDLKIPFKKEKLIEAPVESLLNCLDKQQKGKILKIFVNETDIKGNEKGVNKVLIMTTPLFYWGKVASKEAQIKIYEKIINKVKSNNNYIVIKPHPRDNVEYSKYFKDISILNKSFPIEILNFSEQKYDKVIALYSTGFDSIKFAKEKILLGMENI